MVHSVLNVKALIVTFNYERVLVGAFSVIVKTDGSFAALFYTVPSTNPGNLTNCIYSGVIIVITIHSDLSNNTHGIGKPRNITLSGDK